MTLPTSFAHFLPSFSELLVQRGLGLAMTDDQLDVVPGRDQE